jgi:DNA-binding NarL/FixJ family response regulator
LLSIEAETEAIKTNLLRGKIMPSKTLPANKTLVTDPDNLKQKPAAAPSGASVVAIGDLHGNALKLLHFLIKEGVADIAEQDYQKFYDLYHTVPATQESMIAIKALIDKQLQIIDTTPLIRLIGDELADRGANDFYTLYLLKKLDDSDVKFDINQSNHTMEFTLAHESNGIGQFVSRLGPGQANSAVALRQSIESGVVSLEEVEQLIGIHKEHQRIISYTLTDDGIALYSHAPIDVKIVKALAAKFGVDYHDATAELLAYTIEKINQKYVEVVKQNKLHDYIDQNVLCNPDHYPAAEYPIEHIVWSRNYRAIDRSVQPEGFGYQIGYVYGHDSGAPEAAKGDNIVCLDSLFGKEIVPGIEVEECGDAVDCGYFGVFAVENPILKDNGRCLSPERVAILDQQRPDIIMLQQLKKLCENYRSHLADYQEADDALLRAKRGAIDHLINKLNDPQSSPRECVQNFKADFNANKATLAESRGSAPEWLTAFFRGIKLAFFKYVCQDQSLADKTCFFRGSHGSLFNQTISNKVEPLHDQEMQLASRTVAVH